MEINRALGVALVLVLLAIVCPLIDSTGKLSAKTGLDPKLNDNSSIEKASDIKSVSNSTEIGGKVKPVGGDQLHKSEGIDSTKSENNVSSQSGSEETDRLNKGKSDSSDRLKQNMRGNNQKENLSGMQESKEVPKEKGNEGDKEEPLTHFEECDPTNKCTDKENKLVACLRVPGNGV
uniref:Uncharacterized protein LOC105124266 isoform X3 n=1 Tax=Rhizophora mucronata TaxID=61149 RepID=A0A2P2JRY2_RHIMU